MATSARLEELTKKFDESPRRYFAPLANEYRKLGDLTQAVAICRAHLPNQPGHVSGHIVLAQALYESGELGESRLSFESALDLDPENLIALRFLGDIAREQGDADIARGWYERVLDADPRNDEIASLLAELNAAATARQTFEADGDTWSADAGAGGEGGAIVNARAESAPPAAIPATPPPPALILDEPSFSVAGTFTIEEANSPSRDAAHPAPVTGVDSPGEAGGGFSAESPAARDAEARNDAISLGDLEAIADPADDWFRVSAEQQPAAPAPAPLDEPFFPDLASVTPPNVVAVDAVSPPAPVASSALSEEFLELSFESDVGSSSVEGETEPSSAPSASAPVMVNEGEPSASSQVDEPSMDLDLHEVAAATSAEAEVVSDARVAAAVDEPAPAYAFFETSRGATESAPESEFAEPIAEPIAERIEEPIAELVAELVDVTSEVTSDESIEVRLEAPTAESAETSDGMVDAGLEDVRDFEASFDAPEPIAAEVPVAPVSEVVDPWAPTPVPDAFAAIEEAPVDVGEPNTAWRADAFTHGAPDQLPPPAYAWDDADVGPDAAFSTKDDDAEESEWETYGTSPFGRTPLMETPAAEPTPVSFVTETMAELYVQQGFVSDAIGIYRQLLAQSPDDGNVRARLEQLERGDESSRAEVGEPRVDREGQSARAFFSYFARREPGRNEASDDRLPFAEAGARAGGAAPALDEPSASTQRAADATWPDVGREGAPFATPAASAPVSEPLPTLDAREATEATEATEPTESTERFASVATNDEALTRPDPSPAAAPTLETLFGTTPISRDDAAAAETLAAAFSPEPEATSPPEASAGRGGELSLQHLFRDVPARSSGAVTLDEFFSGGSGGGAPSPSGGPPTGQERADIEQFTAWLEGLKKK